MPMSQVQIVTQALLSFGQVTPISDIEEKGNTAFIARQVWDFVRKSLLNGEHSWNCAKVMLRALASVASGDMPDGTASRWSYCYRLPDDYLKFRFLMPFDVARWTELRHVMPEQELLAWSVKDYDIAAGLLFCNLPAAYLTYTCDMKDVSKFSSTFTEGMVSALADAMVYPITKDRTLSNDTKKLASQTIAKAEAKDSSDLVHEIAHRSDILEARL